MPVIILLASVIVVKTCEMLTPCPQLLILYHRKSLLLPTLSYLRYQRPKPSSLRTSSAYAVSSTLALTTDNVPSVTHIDTSFAVDEVLSVTECTGNFGVSAVLPAAASAASHGANVNNLSNAGAGAFYANTDIVDLALLDVALD